MPKASQKAIITLEDAAPGKMRVSIKYVPAVPGKGPVTSTAVVASLDFLKFLADRQPQGGLR